GRVMMYNQAAASLWGRESEIGKDLWCGSGEMYRPHGGPLPPGGCAIGGPLREGRPLRGQRIIIQGPNGSKRHIFPHPAPMGDAVGNIVGAVNMLVDITDRKRAERATAHLAAIVDSSDSAIVGKDLQGVVTSWNRAAERLFGYTAGEMIGRSILRVIPPDRLDEETRILDRIGRGLTVEPFETIRRRKDGSDVPVSLTISPIIDTHGRVIG